MNWFCINATALEDRRCGILNSASMFADRAGDEDLFHSDGSLYENQTRFGERANGWKPVQPVMGNLPP